MADAQLQDGRPGFSRRWWKVPIMVLLTLLLVAALLVLAASAAYDSKHPNALRSVLAANVLLNGAVVVTLGAIVTTGLSVASEIRGRKDRAAEARLELFRRMRDTHVKVALAQQVLRAQQDTVTYSNQIRALMPVVKAFEEVREEVKVSGDLYVDGDRRAIVNGIALIIIYVQRGVAEFAIWREQADREPSEPRPYAEDSWVVELVADHDSGRLARDPSDENWEPAGHMPRAYDEGLEKSKLIMRSYVYGTKQARAQ